MTTRRTRIPSTASLEVVGELASLINTTYDLAEIFRQAIGKLHRVLEFRRASVVLVSADRGEYYLHTLFDAARGGFLAPTGAYPVGQGLTGTAIRTGTALRIDDHPGLDELRLADDGKVSVLIVPLQVDRQVIGTLNFGIDAPAAYDDDDLDLAVVLGRQIETSLRHSKLLATIHAQREALAAENAEALAERGRLEALIEASDAAILMVSGGQVTFANRDMAALVGLPREILKGAPLDQVHRALERVLRDPAALAAQRAALGLGGDRLRDRVEFAFPVRRICDRTVTAVRGRDGATVGHLVLYRDVTREAEAQAAKDEFVSVVSHELRTPLTSLKTSLTLLLKGAAGPIGDSMRGLVEIALRSLERLIRIVEDLLDLSRIESGRWTTMLAVVPLGSTARRALEAVQGFAQERGVRLECGADDGLSAMGDPDRLEQVVINLVANAIKFSPPGARVGLRWWKQDDAAVLEVSDEGPGIPADQLERIFEKFHQLETATTRLHGGAGLGLAISRSIVAQLGGDLWAESELGRGSRFFVRLAAG